MKVINSIKDLPAGDYTIEKDSFKMDFNKTAVGSAWEETHYQIMLKSYNDYCFLVSHEEWDCIIRGRIIEAIKLYRQRNSCGLKLAKDIIDLVRNS